MIIYLDMCCLKRPFDDQTQPRIAVETEAVFAILRAAKDGSVTALRSLAHELENSRNSNPRRSRAVAAWLETLNPLEPTPSAVSERTRQFVAEGLRELDAYHLAWAEHLGADILATTDDSFISRSSRLAGIIRVRVLNPVGLVEELPL